MSPDTNQRLRALAAATAREINALGDAHESQIKEIYQRFRTQYAAIKAEATTADLTRPGDGSLPTTDKQSQGIN